MALVVHTGNWCTGTNESDHGSWRSRRKTQRHVSREKAAKPLRYCSAAQRRAQQPRPQAQTVVPNGLPACRTNPRREALRRNDKRRRKPTGFAPQCAKCAIPASPVAHPLGIGSLVTTSVGGKGQIVFLHFALLLRSSLSAHCACGFVVSYSCRRTSVWRRPV
jgi:hypothetical protein